MNCLCPTALTVHNPYYADDSAVFLATKVSSVCPDRRMQRVVVVGSFVTRWSEAGTVLAQCRSLAPAHPLIQFLVTGVDGRRKELLLRDASGARYCAVANVDLAP